MEIASCSNAQGKDLLISFFFVKQQTGKKQPYSGFTDK